MKALKVGKTPVQLNGFLEKNSIAVCLVFSGIIIDAACLGFSATTI
jgi:hypothetical protein